MTLGNGHLDSGALLSTPPILTYKESAYAAVDLMAQITAAHHGDPPGHGGGQQLPHLPQPPGNLMEPDLHELNLLLEYTGPRTFLFLRPDLHRRGRPTTFMQEIEVHTTLADIQAALLLAWPDLVNARAWTILEPNPRLRDSTLIPQHVDPFVLSVSSDLPTATALPVVLELQEWDLSTGDFLILFAMSQSASRVCIFICDLSTHANWFQNTCWFVVCYKYQLHG